MQKLDISSLSVDELDLLIKEATRRRVELNPSYPSEPPAAMELITGTHWKIQASPVAAAVQVFHPSYGWLAFAVTGDVREAIVAGIAKDMPPSSLRAAAGSYQ